MSNVCCQLCGATTKNYHQGRNRSYFQCQNCSLVFVSPSEFVPPETEKEVYDLHQNSSIDAGYRKFLSRLVDPLKEKLPAGSVGLDFGSGPGPTISVMFAECGYPMEIYDKFYAPDDAVLEKKYDFITATEVVEHLRSPGQTLQRIWKLLHPGGFLGIMTKMVISCEAFAKWHYKEDETHVCFFSKETFVWLGQQWNTVPVFWGKDVIIFEKSDN